MFISPISLEKIAIALFLLTVSYSLQAQGNSLAKNVNVSSNINLQHTVVSSSSIFKTFEDTKSILSNDGNPSFDIKIESNYQATYGCAEKTGVNLYTFTNNVSETTTGENFASDIIVDLGASFNEPGFNDKSSSLENALNSSANLIKVFVNNQPVYNHMLEYVDGRFRIKFNEINDPESASIYGFYDLDKDGFYDDLPEGGSFVVKTITATECRVNKSGQNAARILFNNNKGTNLSLATQKEGHNLGNHIANQTHKVTFPTTVAPDSFFTISANTKAIFNPKAYSGGNVQNSELEFVFNKELDVSNISFLDSYNREITFKVTGNNRVLTLKIPLLSQNEQPLSDLVINGLKIHCVENSNLEVQWSWRYVCEDCDICKITWLEGINSIPTTGCVPFDLAIDKKVNEENPYVEDEVVFTITVENTSALDARDVVVKDVLPSGYSFISAKSDDNYNEGTGEWILPIIPSKSTKTLKVTAKVLASGLYTNTATLLSYVGGEDSIASNNQSSAATQPLAPKITLIQEGVFNDENNDSYAQVGETISYSFTVKNIGNTPVYNIDVTDDIITVEGVAITSLEPNTEDKTSFKGVYTITQNDINRGIAFNRANAKGYDLKNNEVIAFSDDLIDYEVPDCATCSVVFLPQNESVSLIKSYTLADTNADGIKGTAGDVITYIFDITNTGTITLTNLMLNDAMLGIEDMLLSPVNLEPNQTTQLSIDYIITLEDVQRGYVENTATVIGENPSDENQFITDHSDSGTNFTGDDVENPDDVETPNPDGNNDNDSTNDPTVTILSGTIDLSIDKQVNILNPVVGTEVTFTITLVNQGSISATVIEVLEALPSGYEYVDHTTSLGDYSSLNGKWLIDELIPNQTATLRLVVKVLDEGDYVNTVSIENYEGVVDSNELNNIGSAEVSPKCLKIYNEFSPNDDGKNETFTIDCIQNYSENVLSVFNRWGTTVFETSKYDNSWTGISNVGASSGKELPSGTYYYVLKLGEGEEDVKGWLYINR